MLWFNLYATDREIPALQEGERETIRECKKKDPTESARGRARVRGNQTESNYEDKRT